MAQTDKTRSYGWHTRAVHAAQTTQTSGSIAPDMVLSTTFERQHDGSYPAGFQYTRTGNPNRAALETALAALEDAAQAFVFASGLAAINALMQTLHAGDHVLIPHDMYFGARDLLQEMFPAIHCQAVNMTDSANVADALRDETRLVWMETPSNPQLNITDIRAVAQLARDADALSAVDNTWGTPLLQRPLDLGADISMYSTTKYHGGHSDVLGGALLVRDGLQETLGAKLAFVQGHGGAVPSPFDCWLLLRSLPTMPLRVQQQTRSAAQIAEFLDAHAAVHTVHYPGLETHPQHAIAAQQMHGGFGGMVSFCVEGGYAVAREVANRVQLIRQATSLGGVESLIEHRAAIEGDDSPTPPELLRLSVGIEDAADLIDDLSQALG